jgi:ABC-type amino acid transport substrate-binding protein
MTRILVALVLVAPTATAGAVTPAASPSPDGSQRTDQQAKRVGGDRVERAETFDGGLQIGTTAAGASLVTFLKRGSCVLDLPSISTTTVAPTPWPGFVPAVSKATCTVTGAAVGDTVLFAGLDVFDTATTNYEALRLSRCKVTATDTLSCWFHYSGTAAFDPPDLTLHYVVLR